MSKDVAIVLAAGEGTRMHSDLPKVLHPLAGKPMLTRVLDNLSAAGFERPLIVVGHGAELVQEQMGARGEYVRQAELLGTGNAVRAALEALGPSVGRLLVVHGDEALIPAEKYRALLDLQAREMAAVALLTAICRDTRGLGRVIRDGNRLPVALIQERELSQDQRAIQEVNLGAYVFEAAFLQAKLGSLEPHAPKGEHYLTDVVAKAANEGLPVASLVLEDGEELLGINTLADLERAGNALYRRKNFELMESGVTILDSGSTFIEDDAHIDQGVVIHPFTVIRGRSRISADCVIGPAAQITDSEIGRASQVVASTITNAELGEKVRVGPYAHIRPGTQLGPGVEIGSHAEIKASTLGTRTRMHHFGYVGDAEIGEEVNLGAGVVTCNYDGLAKHRTRVGDRAFIGSDTMLRAPIEVGEGAYIGAGSVVTHDVEPGSTVAGVPARPLEQSSGKHGQKAEEEVG